MISSLATNQRLEKVDKTAYNTNKSYKRIAEAVFEDTFFILEWQPRYALNFLNLRRFFYIHPSGHRTLEQCRNVVEIKSLSCSKLNFNITQTSTAR